MSDLWGWVVKAVGSLREQGHGRLADVIMSLPTEVCHDRHARADALAAEGLALCQDLDQPWIEIFLRHWHLQSRVLHRMEGEAALGACVALVDRSHQPDTERCPQSVCTVQDLASCYGNVDGPGYARERLAVADEALARIDPSWPCFSCISEEKASALRDQAGPAESLAFLDAQVAAMVLAGQPRAIHEMPRERLEALIALGRWPEALAFVDDGDRNGRTSAHAVMERRIARARLLARLGRLDEAARALPAVAEVAPTPYFFVPYGDALERLARGGRIPNDGALGRTLAGFVDRLLKQGVLRDALHLAERHGLLAVDRDAPHTALRALATMESIVERLSRPLDAQDHVAAMRAGVFRAEGYLPDARTAGEVLAHLAAEKADPERALLVLEVACRALPGDASLARARAQALRAQGLPGEAAEVLAALYEAHPGDVDLAIEAGHALREAGDADRFEAFLVGLSARATDAEARAVAPWLRALAALEHGDLAAAVIFADRVLAERPGAVDARLLRARVARATGDFATELAQLSEAIALGAQPGPADWDRMIAATVVGAWDAVLASAKRLGMDLPGPDGGPSEGPEASPGEGVIDVAGEPCRLRFDDGPDLFARRTGPVTARVLGISVPPRAQRYGEVWVFQARPLNAPPADDGARERHLRIYPVVTRLTPSRSRVFFLDGLHPGDQALASIEAALTEAGSPLVVLSGERYRVGDGALGLYAAMPIADDVPLAPVHAALVRSVEACGAELTWADLARAAGDDTVAAEHAATARRLGL